MTDEQRELVKFGELLHQAKAERGPGILCYWQFRIERFPLMTAFPQDVTHSITWMRPFSNRRWSMYDKLDTFDAQRAALWFGP